MVVENPTERLVVLALVLKKLVVVALVEVLLRAVKFWRVLDPVTRRLGAVMSPVVVRVAVLRVVNAPKVENSVVVVAFVVVLFSPVKFWKVEEAFARRLAKVPRPDEVRFPPEAVVKKRFVVLALVAKKFVVVALVEVELTMLVKVLAPEKKLLSAKRVDEADDAQAAALACSTPVAVN